MVWIPGGAFAMGSELEGSRLNEKPVRVDKEAPMTVTDCAYTSPLWCTP